MDVSYLKPDELDVEFDIRKIPSNSVDAVEQLKEKIAAEIENTSLVPRTMHNNASRRPDTELEKCRTKLFQHQENLTDVEYLRPDARSQAVFRINSRLIHVRGRLERLSKSPTYGVQAQSLLESCRKLIDTLQTGLTDVNHLNESVDQAKNVRIESDSPDSDTALGGDEFLPSGSKDRTSSVTEQDGKHSGCPLPTDAVIASDSTGVLAAVVAQLSEVSQQLAQMKAGQDALRCQASKHGQETVATASSVSPVREEAPAVRSSGSDRVSLSRCGVTYTGSPTGITVEMFLFQLDSVTMSQRLSPATLLLDLHLILKDLALHWYWTYRKHHPQADWYELRHELVERFKDRRTNYEIRQMVESRKQQAGENFIDFYNHIWALTLQCRTPYADEELIQILRSNMKPALQFHLTDRHFDHVQELVKSCTAWETTIRRFGANPVTTSYGRRGINEISVGQNDEEMASASFVSGHGTDRPTEFALEAFSRPARGTGVVTGRAVGDRPAVLQSSGAGNNNIICFNCDDIGHTFRECPTPPVGYFCFKCGLKGTVVSTCRRCAENPQRGSWRMGPREPQISNPPQVLLPPRQQLQDAASNTDPELTRLTQRRF